RTLRLKFLCRFKQFTFLNPNWKFIETKFTFLHPRWSSMVAQFTFLNPIWKYEKRKPALVAGFTKKTSIFMEFSVSHISPLTIKANGLLRNTQLAQLNHCKTSFTP